MARQRHQIRLAYPMAEVFAALLESLAPRRWAEAPWPADDVAVPAVGCRYVNQRRRVTRRGRVLECQRPVSLTLYESLIDPPCRVRLKLRWRLEPTDTDSVLRLEVGYELNAAASLRRRHWQTRISMHCARMLEAAARQVELRARGAQAGTIGHNHGSSSIVQRNITAVRGKPSFK